MESLQSKWSWKLFAAIFGVLVVGIIAGIVPLMVIKAKTDSISNQTEQEHKIEIKERKGIMSAYPPPSPSGNCGGYSKVSCYQDVLDSLKAKEGYYPCSNGQAVTDTCYVTKCRVGTVLSEGKCVRQ